MRVSCPLRADLKSDLSNLTKRREALDRAQGDAFGQEAVQFALDQRQLRALNLSTRTANVTFVRLQGARAGRSAGAVHFASADINAGDALGSRGRKAVLPT